MFIRLKTRMTVPCSKGRTVDVPADTPVNYGSERIGEFMRHWFHVPIRRIIDCNVEYETATYTETLPIKTIPEWL
jgi:hypothetical protein